MQKGNLVTEQLAYLHSEIEAAQTEEMKIIAQSDYVNYVKGIGLPKEEIATLIEPIEKQLINKFRLAKLNYHYNGIELNNVAMLVVMFVTENDIDQNKLNIPLRVRGREITIVNLDKTLTKIRIQKPMRIENNVQRFELLDSTDDEAYVSRGYFTMETLPQELKPYIDDYLKYTNSND